MRSWRQIPDPFCIIFPPDGCFFSPGKTAEDNTSWGLGLKINPSVARGSQDGERVELNPQEMDWGRNFQHLTIPCWDESCPRGGDIFGNIVGILGRNVSKPLPAFQWGPILSLHRDFSSGTSLIAVTPSQKRLNGSAGPPTSLGSIFPGVAALQPNRICSTPICQDWTRHRSWWRCLLNVFQGLEQGRQFPSWARSTAPIPVLWHGKVEGVSLPSLPTKIRSNPSSPPQNRHPGGINICYPPFPAAGKGERWWSGDTGMHQGGNEPHVPLQDGVTVPKLFISGKREISAWTPSGGRFGNQTG